MNSANVPKDLITISVIELPITANKIQIHPDLVELLVLPDSSDFSMPDQMDRSARFLRTLFEEWDRVEYVEWSGSIPNHIAHRLNLMNEGRSDLSSLLKSIFHQHTGFLLPSLWGEEMYQTFLPVMRFVDKFTWSYGLGEQERLISCSSATSALRIGYDLYQRDRQIEISSKTNNPVQKGDSDEIRTALTDVLLRRAVRFGGEIQTSRGKCLLKISRKENKFSVHIAGIFFSYTVGGKYPLWKILLEHALHEIPDSLNTQSLVELFNNVYPCAMFTNDRETGLSNITFSKDCEELLSNNFCGRSTRLISRITPDGLWHIILRRMNTEDIIAQTEATAILSHDRKTFRDAYVKSKFINPLVSQTWCFCAGNPADLLMHVLGTASELFYFEN